MSGAQRTAILVKRFPKLSETFILGEIQALVDAGLEVDIVSLYRPDEDLQQPDSEPLMHRVHYLEDLGSMHRMKTWAARLIRMPARTLRLMLEAARQPGQLAQTAALLQVCDEQGLSHLHAHYLSEPAELASRVSRFSGNTYSVSAHAKDIYLSKPEDIRERIRHASFVATCTAQNGVHLKQLAGVDADKVHVIYHGIDSLHFRPRQATEPDGEPSHPCCGSQAGTGALRIVAVGRFKQKKGFDLLIDACALLADERRDIVCEIIGYGDQESALRQRIVEHGVSGWVSLRPPVTHAHMVEELQQADLFVLPCRQCVDGDRDGIPNALLEAMACGVPVLSTRVSGIPEVIVSGHNGLLVEPDDADALANAIRRLADDAALRRRLGRQGREVVTDRFDWQSSAHSLIDLLTQRAGQIERPRIAYILKGFPRLSESFIANEIRQLNSHGMQLGLFSVKHGDAMVDADDLPPVHYAPLVSSLTNVKLRRWLRENLPSFSSDQCYWLRRHPLRHVGTLAFAVSLGFRQGRALHDERDVKSARTFKKSAIKEFLLATHFARQIDQQQGYVHIHAHFCHDATSIAWMASRLCGIPFSFTAHAKDIYQRRLNPGDLLQRKLDAARFAVTCTEANVRELRKLVDRPDKVHGIYHGLNTELFIPGDLPAHSSDDLPLILSVGRHVEKKGFIYLVEASGLLRDRGVRHRLHIIGEEGDQTALLQARIEEYGLQDSIRLLPPLQQRELVDCYRKASAFVLPCIVLDDGDRDGIPNVMAEAMACALPVIVTGVSGIPEMVDDRQTGLIVPQRNPDKLADAIEEVLCDRVLARRVGQAARLRVEERFDAQATHVTLRDLFRSQVSRQEAVSV